jgi:hypothetical protein
VPVDTVHYSPGFVPYGTPCGEDVDPVRAKLAEMEREIEELRAEVRVEKRPALRNKQGMYALISEHGVVLRRGQDLAGVLAPLERRLMRLVG